MSFSFGIVEREVSALLGNIKGATMADAESAFTATASTTNRQNVDFPPTFVQDAIVNAISDIVLAIAETPRHPERPNYQGFTIALSNRSIIPALDSVGSPFIGIRGRVFDSVSGKSCLPVALEKVRSFNEFASSVYSGFTPFWYAYSGSAIEHTRTSVQIEGCVWVRPVFVTANTVPLDDIHETPVVMGALVRLAPREGVYLELWNAAEKIWTDHLTRIRALGMPEASTDANSAPSTV